MNTNYIFITGGVLSGLGKGVATASIGLLLQSKGYSVTAIKIDPYINADAGTMNPFIHGEVFVTDDGGEIDQDFGHYERFLGINLKKDHNITTGQIYRKVIDKERRGDFLGRCVQIVPHITDEIKERIYTIAKKTKADFVLTEIGGTVGDIEEDVFLEAIRQIRIDHGFANVQFVHLGYVPEPKNIGELKTKPIQHSVERLREHGIQPDFIICRYDTGRQMEKNAIKKIALFGGVPKESVISNPHLENIYQLPLVLDEQKVGEKILKRSGLLPTKSDLNEWRKFVKKANNTTEPVRIAIVGKYFAQSFVDSYISIIEAVRHAAWHNNRKPMRDYIGSESFEKDESKLSELDSFGGIIVPGGFGIRGSEGKILAIKYARENDIPYLGLCYGLQLAVVEFARNVCGLEGANSTEIVPDTPHPVIDLLPEQEGVEYMGGTMRLGSYPTILKPKTKVWELYGKKDKIKERHRHRWEVNPDYHDVLQKNGMIFSGMSPDGRLVEFIELEDNLFFVATQAHPEFTSRPLSPNPIFNGFVKACILKSATKQ